jgi:hypothetical protein
MKIEEVEKDYESLGGYFDDEDCYDLYRVDYIFKEKWCKNREELLPIFLKIKEKVEADEKDELCLNFYRLMEKFEEYEDLDCPASKEEKRQCVFFRQFCGDDDCCNN